MIEWFDSVRPYPEWQHLSDYHKSDPISCVSVGFMIYDGKDVKAIAPNMGDISSETNIQASGIIHIPTCSVKKITDLIEKG